MPQVLFRAIKAKTPNWPAFYAEIARTVDTEVKPALIRYFNRVTHAWDNQPTFKATKRITQQEISVNVFPTGPNADIWRYVSKGTRPHKIKPKGQGYPLKFNWGGKGSYKARTSTRGGYNGPGKVVGGKITRLMYVNHPGNKARNFERHIARWYAPQYRRTMKNAVARALRRAKQGAK